MCETSNNYWYFGKLNISFNTRSSVLTLNKLKAYKHPFLISHSVIDYCKRKQSSSFLNNNTQLGILLRTSYNLYSTKYPRNLQFNNKTRDRYSSKTKFKSRLPLASLARPSKFKIYTTEGTNSYINSTNFVSPTTNYIKGWRSNWLRKIRFMERLGDYKLDKNDKLLISILKERKNNLNKKMYQEPGYPNIGVEAPLNPELDSLNRNDLASLSSMNNRNSHLNILSPNRIGVRPETRAKQLKFTTAGKAKDFITTQFIQYKFNKSNTKYFNSNL